MYMRFAENLKKLRIERGLSQRELADLIYVDRSTVGRWESGKRLPDAVMIFRLSRCLGVDTGTLLSIAEENDEVLKVILVDDQEIILTGGLPVLEAALPNATIAGFTRPSEAIEYARANQIALGTVACALRDVVLSAGLAVVLGKVFGLTGMFIGLAAASAIAYGLLML